MQKKNQNGVKNDQKTNFLEQIKSQDFGFFLFFSTIPMEILMTGALNASKNIKKIKKLIPYCNDGMSFEVFDSDFLFEDKHIVFLPGLKDEKLL